MHKQHDGNGGGAASPSTTPEGAVFTQTTMRWRSSSKAKDALITTTTTNAAAATDGNVVKEGFLTKKGHVLRTQKERYFVLRQHTLSYFRVKRSEKKTKPPMQPSSLKGMLELAASDVITPAPHSDQWFRIQKLPDADGKTYKLDLKGMCAVPAAVVPAGRPLKCPLRRFRWCL